MKQNKTASSTVAVFADLILPVPIPTFFTYHVPSNLRPCITLGQCVIVPFGLKKILTGIVKHLHTNPPSQSYQIKDILDIVNTTKVIDEHQFTLYKWISEYYMCTLGEVMQMALPSGFKLSSKSMVQRHPSFDGNGHFSDNENLVLKELEKGTIISYADIAKLLGVKNIYPILKCLLTKKAIIIFEQIKEKYVPKKEKKIKLSSSFLTIKALEPLFQMLKTKPKQEDILLHYLHNVPVLSHPESNTNGIQKSILTAKNKGFSSLKTLIKNGVFEEFETIVPRYHLNNQKNSPSVLLTTQQKQACDKIINLFKQTNTVLLHGITGSGKTEIYIDLITKTLKNNFQVLLLIPEIALTTQIVQRLKRTMGDNIGVYHSKFSDNERLDIWNGVLSGKLPFIVGARSAVFLPFNNLGLIIVDEEHDSSYKQHNSSPRYNARDVALMMAQHHKANILLGTATPSTESYFQTIQHNYGLVNLGTRFGKATLPDIFFVDMNKEKKYNTRALPFSSYLLKEMEQVLHSNEQILLFQNRRGYAPMVQCEDCNWIPECANCSVILTYHQFNNRMICHYCGYNELFPHHCPTCHSKRIFTKGYGTEKLEEELQLLFEHANVQRMDRDTARTRAHYQSIIEDFEQSKIHILVGTQMITKGLDFNNVGLVGILDADHMRHFPDFRSHERAFQLMIQVSGRAGRREKKGKVIIQTTNPSHILFDYVRTTSVKKFIEYELHDRCEHDYPPYIRLIEIIIKHAHKIKCEKTAKELVKYIDKNKYNIKIIGPGEPLISKIRHEFLRTILIKIPRNQGQLNIIKQHLQDSVNKLLSTQEHRCSKIVFNIDPM